MVTTFDLLIGFTIAQKQSHENPTLCRVDALRPMTRNIMSFDKIVIHISTDCIGRLKCVECVVRKYCVRFSTKSFPYRMSTYSKLMMIVTYRIVIAYIRQDILWCCLSSDAFIIVIILMHWVHEQINVRHELCLFACGSGGIPHSSQTDVRTPHQQQQQHSINRLIQFVLQIKKKQKKLDKHIRWHAVAEAVCAK